jgi:hypothetical protein
MARILLDATEVDVAEDVEEILNRIVNSRDGLRLGSGTIIAPPGWVHLTAMVTEEPIYVQVARIGFVRGD